MLRKSIMDEYKAKVIFLRADSSCSTCTVSPTLGLGTGLDQYDALHWVSLHLSPLKKILKQFFRAFLGLQLNWREGAEISHNPLSLHMHSFLHYQHPPQSGALVTTDNLQGHIIITIVHIAVHSWCCNTLYGYNDMYPSLWYHTEYFHCP